MDRNLLTSFRISTHVLHAEDDGGQHRAGDPFAISTHVLHAEDDGGQHRAGDPFAISTHVLHAEDDSKNRENSLSSLT